MSIWGINLGGRYDSDYQFSLLFEVKWLCICLQLFQGREGVQGNSQNYKKDFDVRALWMVRDGIRDKGRPGP